MNLRFTLATIVGFAAAMAAPWAWLTGAILLAIPMTFLLWWVARLTDSRLVVRSAISPPPTHGPSPPRSDRTMDPA